MERSKKTFERENHLPNLHFWVPAVNFPGCNPMDSTHLLSGEGCFFFWGGEDINMYLHCFYISFYIFFVINRFCETYLGCKLSRWIGGITQSIAGASTDLDFVD